MAGFREIRIAALQAGGLMALGDMLAQRLVPPAGPVQPYDMTRTLRFAAVGTFLGGPALRVWYGVLNKYIGSSGKTVVLKKVVVDQMLFAPTFIAVLLSTLGILEGKKLQDIKSDISEKYPDILKTNYYIWPWVQVTNFYLTPLKYQVLTVQGVAVLWNTYLSWKTQQ